MGMFSGFMKSVLPAGLTMLGNYFLPGIGGAIGGAVGGFIKNNSGDIAKGLGDAAKAGIAGETAKSGVEEQNKANLENQWNMADFNAGQAQLNRNFQEQMFGRSQEFNKDQAQLNREFQERMSNTQYQRAVGDMQEAGLNPMLAYQQGGAGGVAGSAASVSAPSGSQASGPGPARIEDRLAPLVSSAWKAVELQNVLKQGELMDAQAKETLSRIPINEQTRYKLQEETAEVRAKIDTLLGNTRNERAKAALLDVQRDLALMEAKFTAGKISLNEWQTEIARVDAALKKAQINEAMAKSDMWGSKIGHDLLPWVPHVSEGLQSVGSIIRSVRPY